MTLNAHTGSLDPWAPNEPRYADVVHHANVKPSLAYVARKTGLRYHEADRLLELALKRGDLAGGAYSGRKLVKRSDDHTKALQARIAELEAWQEDVRSNSPLLARLDRAEQRVQELEAERDEADRRAGAAEREVARMKRDVDRVAQESLEALSPERIDKAAQTLAHCMDYPWDFMPDEGKAGFRKYVKAIIGAATGATQEAQG